jgi:tetratricopeptide (TPR) repeat protein
LSFTNVRHDRTTSAGLRVGAGGITAYYRRDRDVDHGAYYDNGFGYGYGGRIGHGYGFGDGLFQGFGGVSHYGVFNSGIYYPYGYTSVFDNYFYRYPYQYVTVADYSPVWTVQVPRTVYVEGPTEVVYVDGAPPVVSELPAAPRDGADTVDIRVEPQDRIPVNNSFLADGLVDFREGRYSKARRKLSYAVLDDPTDGFAEIAYSLALLSERNFTAAASAVRRGLSLAPDVIDRPVDLVRLYGDRDSFYKHVSNLVSYVSDSRGDADALFLLGFIQYSSGEPREAARSLGQAAKLAPGDTFAAVLRDAAERVKVSD